MNFIRNIAIKSYRKEMIHFTEILSKQETMQLAKFVAFSIWIRSMLQIEGHINPLRNHIETNGKNNSPELEAYPLMLKDIKKFIKILKNNRQTTKVAALQLWVHTLQAIIRPELNLEVVELWIVVMKVGEYLEDEIKLMRKEDLELGIEENLVQETADLASRIIKSLPPKQITYGT